MENSLLCFKRTFDSEELDQNWELYSGLYHFDIGLCGIGEYAEYYVFSSACITLLERRPIGSQRQTRAIPMSSYNMGHLLYSYTSSCMNLNIPVKFKVPPI